MRTLGDTPILVSLAQEAPDDFMDVVCWPWYTGTTGMKTKTLDFKCGPLEPSNAVQASQE